MKDNEFNLKSRKFLSYFGTITIGLIIFLVVSFSGKGASQMEGALNFLVYALGIYVSGNSVHHIAKTINKK